MDYTPLIQVFQSYNPAHVNSVLPQFQGAARAILNSHIEGWKGKYPLGLDSLKDVDISTLDPELLFLFYTTRAKLLYYCEDTTAFLSQMQLIEGLDISKMDVSVHDYFKGKLLHLKGMKAALANDQYFAEINYSESIRIKKNIADESGCAESLCSLGMIKFELGDLNQAEQYLRQSLDIYLKHNNHYGTAFMRANLATVYFHQGLVELAKNTAELSLKEYNELDVDPSVISPPLQILGLIHFSLKNYELAVSYLEKSKDLVAGDSPSSYYFNALYELTKFHLMAGMEPIYYLKFMALPEGNELAKVKKAIVWCLSEKKRGIVPKVNALLKLEKYLSDHILSRSFTVRVTLIVTLIEIRLEILRFDVDRENLESLEKLITILYNIGVEQNSEYYILNSTMFLAVLQLTLGNIKLGQEYMERTMIHARRTGNLRLIDKIEEKYQEFQTVASKWLNLLEKNPEFVNKMRSLELQEYLEKVSTIVSTEFI